MGSGGFLGWPHPGESQHCRVGGDQHHHQDPQGPQHPHQDHQHPRECKFYHVCEVPTFTLISPRPGGDEGGGQLFEEEMLPGKGPFSWSLGLGSILSLWIITTSSWSPPSFVIIVIITTTRVITIILQEYSEEDIHRAIGICAINSVTLEPRRLFQGPAKGQFWEIWSKYSCHGNL